MPCRGVNMDDNDLTQTAAEDLLSRELGQFGTILADPPWQFMNRTGKMAPEHKRLSRYSTSLFFPSFLRVLLCVCTGQNKMWITQ